MKKIALIIAFMLAGCAQHHMVGVKLPPYPTGLAKECNSYALLPKDSKPTTRDVLIANNENKVTILSCKENNHGLIQWIKNLYESAKH